MTKKALGRGLNSLIPDIKKDAVEKKTDAAHISRKDILEIPIDKITSNPFQPRTKFDDAKISELAASIKAQGVIQPLIVRQQKDGYELIAGERRLLACRRLQLSFVPVIVREASDEDSLELALIENIQRDDLNSIDEAKAYEMLMEKHSLTQDAVADKVGKSRAAVANTLRLLKLPDEVQQYLLQGKLSMGQAKPLLSLNDPESQKVMAIRIIAQNLSAREVEHLISLKTGEKHHAKKLPKKRNVSASPYVQSMADKLQEKLATKVTITENSKKGTGKIEIEYYSHDDLDRIFHVFDK